MPISRLQLAAALVEYDNDEDLASPGRQSDPQYHSQSHSQVQSSSQAQSHSQYRNHRQSAIFLPFERAREEHRRQQILSQPPPSLPSPLEISKPEPLPEPVRRQDQKWRKSSLAEFGPLSLSNSTSASGSGSRSGQYDRVGQVDDEERLDDQRYGDEAGEEEGDLGDVDVARWGLPSHLVVEETKKPTQPESNRRASVAHQVPQAVPSPVDRARVKSVHVSDVLDDTALHRQVMAETQAKLEGEHRRALSYDRYSVNQTMVETERNKRLAERPATALGMQNRHKPERIRTISDPIMLPLPNSPLSAVGTRPLSSLSRGWTSPPPGRMDEEEQLEDEPETSPNPFALPAPPPEFGSRFDPKVLQRQRQPSTDTSTMGGFGFHLQSASQSQTPQMSHRRDSGRTTARTPTTGYFDNFPHSAASSSHPHRPDSAGLAYLQSPDREEDNPLKSPAQVYEDIPTPEQFGRPLMPKRYSTSARLQMDRATFLRPKTLIMPAPLANVPPPAIREPKLPEGYVLGEKPIPYEARTLGERPGMPLSLSQKTFRSSLMVGGYREDEYWVGGSEVEGKVGVQSKELDEAAIMRKPGKLYGKSLMDQLEARKSALKSRQRVFTGDSRPAMMARTTMYDPPIVSISPTSPEMGGSAAGQRPHSMHPGSAPLRGPLLAFDSNGDIHSTSPIHPGSAMSDQYQGHERELGLRQQQGLYPGGRIAKSKSVFGVDQLWEKEMVKLRIMQEEERRMEANRIASELAKKQAEDEKKQRKKNKGKNKMSIIVPEVEEDQRPVEEVLGISPIKRAGELPPALQFEPEKAPAPPTPLSIRDSEVGDDGTGEKMRGSQRTSESGSHEEGYGQGVGQAEGDNATGLKAHSDSNSDSDSEEDIPLSRLAPPTRASMRVSTFKPDPESESDSDEDVPLSRLNVRSPAISAISQSNSHTQPLGSLGLTVPKLDHSFGAGLGVGQALADEGDDEDEDDLPLAVKQARARGLKPITKADIIEDDLPLGYKHAEKAQAQMAERSPGSQISWNSRGSGAGAGYDDRNSMHMGMEMGGWNANPHQSFMSPGQHYQHPQQQMMYPYGGGMGIGMGMGHNQYPYIQGQMGMGMGGMHPGMLPGMGMGMDIGMNGGYNPVMGMGGGMGGMGVGMGPQNPEKAIDNWRKDVSGAPIPTSTPATTGTGTRSGEGSGEGRISVVSSVG